MDHEAEVIREQMEGTRESLAKKLETLENEVKGAVQNVTGTVEAVSQTVEKVKETVQGTVESVTSQVESTVDTVKEKVKETFDITGHVRRHPWIGFGVSFAAGFLTGRLVRPSIPAFLGHVQGAAHWVAPSLSTLAEAERPDGRRREEPRPEPAAAPTREEPSRPGLLSNLFSSLGPEVGKLKGLAIGAIAGMARDALTRSLAPEMKAQVTEVINDFTQKLGGEVLHGPVLGGSAEESGAAGQHRGGASDSGPAW